MRKGTKHTPETINKLKEAGKYPHPSLSEEAKLKISLSHLGPQNPNYGKHPSEETRRKLGASHAGPRNHQWGKPVPPEIRAKISNSLRGSKNFNYGRPRDDATVRKIILSNRIRPNKAELKLQEILNQHFPNEWKFVGDGQVIIGGLCPDFINVNNKKLLIELYGDYWHSPKLTKGNWRRTELGRIMHYNSYGFKCIVLWEKELRDEKTLLGKIKSL